MRSVYYSKDFSDSLVIEDEQVHHLKNVLRLKEGDDVLVLNGKGLKAKASLEKINKKNIELVVLEKNLVPKASSLELAVGIPKKENFEDICRVATELGVEKIYAVKCDYSQWSYKHSERLDKILISACLQSNNPWLPEIVSIDNVDNLINLEKTVIPMDFSVGKSIENIVLEKTILFVGPEAGFSNAEREKFKDLSCLELKTPILRATSAVPTGIGYLMGYTR